MKSIELPDFSELQRLAKDEPEALERLRQQRTEELLANAHPDTEQRLRGMAFVLEAKRRVADSPEEAYESISKMMMEQLEMLQDTYSKIKQLATDGQYNDIVLPDASTVVSFSQHQKES